MPEIEALKQEYDEILQKLSDPELISNWGKFEEVQKRKNYLEKIIEKEKELRETKDRIEENKLIITVKEDQELVNLAETELQLLSEKEKVLEGELKRLISQPESLLSPDKIGAKEGDAVIVEIREGTGGEEAGLFAGELFNMHSKYAKN